MIKLKTEVTLTGWDYREVKEEEWLLEELKEIGDALKQHGTPDGLVPNERGMWKFFLLLENHETIPDLEFLRGICAEVEAAAPNFSCWFEHHIVGRNTNGRTKEPNPQRSHSEDQRVAG